MRRYAFPDPCVLFWQLTNVKCTGRGSFSAGAVTVRPTLLPNPCSSVNRYQYTLPAFKFAASTRQVQSVSTLTVAVVVATTRANAASSAISTLDLCASFPSKGRLVHKITLSACGSADATPCGYKSRRSLHETRELCA